MRTEDEIRDRLKEVRARADAHDHAYDKGFADGLAWVLEEKTGMYGEPG
jgi:hypothetical protein